MTVLYKAVPAAFVRWGPASVAGVFAACTIGLLKSAFTRGVVYLTELSHIYGSISVIVPLQTALRYACTGRRRRRLRRPEA